jgi:hypothetical protein
MVNVYRYTHVVHFLATWTLAYKGPYVLTHVRPVVGQANQLGDCAVNAAMPYDGVVTHLKCLELIIHGDGTARGAARDIPSSGTVGIGNGSASSVRLGQIRDIASAIVFCEPWQYGIFRLFV